MAEVYVSAEGLIDAPADLVYSLIADYREHHHRFLPDNFSDFHVEQGGIGSGTVVTFTVEAGGRTRGYRMRIEEPQPGRVMSETDTMSSLRTTWTVTPEGQQTRVQIETRWQGAEGVPGFFERLFAPPAVRRLYRDELRRLDKYARQQASVKVPAGSRS